MRITADALTYQKQMIEMAEESKKFIKLEAQAILNELDDRKLGEWVRAQMLQKIAGCDAHIEHVKNLYQDGIH